MQETVALSTQPIALRRTLAVVLGTALVAAAAQVSVPLPGTPVPMTLQPFAVLLVGGLLGARLGAASLALYVALGAAGLPVFTPTVPLAGVARLFGPTGGYLLAYPVAAFATGWIVTDPGRPPGVDQVSRVPGRAPGVSQPHWTRVALGVLVGLALIHLGGLAQLLILTGDLSAAARFGTLPFLLGDLGKLAIAVLVLTRFTSPVRARL